MTKKCFNNNIQIVSFNHSPRPIDFKIDEWNKIHNLLWYAPSISSIQASSNYLIHDPIYSDVIFDEITDVLMINKIEILSKNELEDFDKESDIIEICTNCQEIIIQKNQNETRVQSLLRHLRNSIAHGRFNIVNDMIVFMDTSYGKLTALIKIYYKNFHKISNVLDTYSVIDRNSSNGIIEEKLIIKAFQKNGFIVKENLKLESRMIDFVVAKNSVQYAVEVKFGDYQPVGAEDKILTRLKKMFFEYKDLGYIPVLIFERGWLTQKAREELIDEEIIVLDKEDLTKFFNGELSDINL